MAVGPSKTIGQHKTTWNALVRPRRRMSGATIPGIPETRICRKELRSFCVLTSPCIVAFPVLVRSREYIYATLASILLRCGFMTAAQPRHQLRFPVIQSYPTGLEILFENPLSVEPPLQTQTRPPGSVTSIIG